jgi:hypothetical protein
MPSRVVTTGLRLEGLCAGLVSSWPGHIHNISVASPPSFPCRHANPRARGGHFCTVYCGNQPRLLPHDFLNLRARRTRRCEQGELRIYAPSHRHASFPQSLTWSSSARTRRSGHGSEAPRWCEACPVHPLPSIRGFVSPNI